VQIGDENAHRVRTLLDEVFGEQNFVTKIGIAKTSGLQMADALASAHDFLLHYCKNRTAIKYRKILVDKGAETDSLSEYFNLKFGDGTQRRMTNSERDGSTALPEGARVFRVNDLTKPGPGSKFALSFRGRQYDPGTRWWGTTEEGMSQLVKADRLSQGGTTVSYIRYLLPKNGRSGMTIPGMNSAVIAARSRGMIFILVGRSQFAGAKPLQPL
jgi:adenine-specific DNA-methyltransferase